MQGKSQGEGRWLGSFQGLSHIIKAAALHITETSASALLWCSSFSGGSESAWMVLVTRGGSPGALQPRRPWSRANREQQAAACAARKAALVSSVLCICKQKQRQEPGWHEIPVATLKATRQDSSTAACPCKARQGAVPPGLCVAWGSCFPPA